MHMYNHVFPLSTMSGLLHSLLDTHTHTYTHTHTHTHTVTQHKHLPVAPPPKPRELAPTELQKMDKQRNSVLREMRMFLRDATNKLLAERKFKEFSQPVDPGEVSYIE